MSISGKVNWDSDLSFWWTIDDFLSISCVRSPNFLFKGIELFMEVSHSKKEDNLHIAVYNQNVLMGKSSCDLRIQLIMNTDMHEQEETRSGTLSESGKLHFFRWMPWTEMLRRRLQILRNGTVIIKCCVNEIPQTAQIQRKNLDPCDENLPDEKEDSDEETCPQTKGVKTLLEAFRSLLTTGEDSDIVIEVQGKEFRAHRGILRARSSVFHSMFSVDMLEKSSGVVKIADCDPKTFPDFLNYIYTGSGGIISKKNVFCLYQASDKYDIGTLKEECVEYMKENLSLDTFCKVITLAVKHNERDLIELATEFFCANSLNIIRTAEWQRFLEENAIVGNELFIKLLMK